MDDEMIGSDGLIIRDSGEWAKDKLYYLNHYLDIMSVGMKNRWPSKLYYVDLFAGPGRCKIRDTGEEVDGSPLIALKYDFAKYFLFEADSASCQALETRVRSRSAEKSSKAVIRNVDCNKGVEEITLPSSSLGLAFIDPTGISQLSFETVRKLCEGRKIDLIINFPEGMGIRMNLHQYTRTEKTALSRFMGSSRWQQLYTRGSLSFDDACRTIAQEYLYNLTSLGYIAVDKDWIPVKTRQNSLLYYLLFASKHPRGTDLWRKIKRIDPQGQRSLNYDAH